MCSVPPFVLVHARKFHPFALIVLVSEFVSLGVRTGFSFSPFYGLHSFRGWGILDLLKPDPWKAPPSPFCLTALNSAPPFFCMVPTAIFRLKIRNTTPKPFSLSSSAKKETMTTEEIRVMRAKAEMQALKQKREKAAKCAATPPKPKPQQERTPTQFKPFSLSSLSIHEKAISMKEAQIAEARKKEEEARKFKARPVSYNKAKNYSDVISGVEKQLATQKKVTVGKEPVLKSMQRSEMHKRMEQEKKAKEVDAAAAAAEEEKKAKEAENQELKNMRKSLQFHAQAMPKFDKPFKPDLSAAAPPTKVLLKPFSTWVAFICLACTTGVHMGQQKAHQLLRGMSDPGFQRASRELPAK